MNKVHKIFNESYTGCFKTLCKNFNGGIETRSLTFLVYKCRSDGITHPFALEERLYK